MVTAYEKKKLALYKRYFKAKSAHKVKDKKNWTSLAEWGYKQITDYLEANDYCQLVKNSEHFSAHDKYVGDKDMEVTRLFNMLRDYGREDTKIKNLESGKSFKKIIVDDSLLKDYLRAWNEMRPTKKQKKALEVINNVDAQGYSRRLNIKISDKIDSSKVKPTHDLFQLVERVAKRYPLLCSIQYSIWNDKEIEDLWAKIAEYANLVDITVVNNDRK